MIYTLYTYMPFKRADRRPSHCHDSRLALVGCLPANIDPTRLVGKVPNIRIRYYAQCPQGYAQTVGLVVSSSLLLPSTLYNSPGMEVAVVLPAAHCIMAYQGIQT